MPEFYTDCEMHELIAECIEKVQGDRSTSSVEEAGSTLERIKHRVRDQLRPDHEINAIVKLIDAVIDLFDGVMFDE